MAGAAGLQPIDRHLTADELTQELAAHSGFIPVGIDAARRELIWLDLDGYHCYEGFFRESLRVYSALRATLGTAPQRFSTALGVLTSLTFTDSLAPTGFIFNGSRCGSTLLARVLGRSRSNLVFSEAAVLRDIWKVVEGDQAGIALYRNLVLAVGRRRLNSYVAHFIKFVSYEILHFARIRAAFPATPALFLFRRPDAVIGSSERTKQPWLGEDVGIGRIWVEIGSATEEIYRAALSIRDPLFRCLDYSSLGPDRLPEILEFFRQQRSAEDVKLMQSQFSWDAKDKTLPRRFQPRSEDREYASPALWDLYNRLAAQSLSDWR